MPAANNQPVGITLEPIRVGPGPEDVLVEADGSVLASLRDGRIVQVDPDSGSTTTLADTKGSPLGLEHLPDGGLLVCDAEQGLLAVDRASGSRSLLVDKVEGKTLRFCNNASVAHDGSIYFSDSSQRYGFARFRADFIVGVPTGRLMRRNPDGSVDVLVEGLAFANGVALAPDGTFVLVAETATGRIHRYSLDGSGDKDVFCSLPAMPDNLSVGSDGLLWVALVAPMPDQLERIHKLPMVVRRLIARLPPSLGPSPERICRVMALAWDGTVVHDLSGDPEQYHHITGARESNGTVWVASIEEDAIARFSVPAR